ncbi:MAG: hypothetical protein ACLQBQ_10670 [Smithella sp.]
MHNSNESRLENDCKELSNAFQDILSWKWDRRFETVLAEFSAVNRDSVRTILNRHLRITWDSLNIGNAPDIVQSISIHFGTLRAGQLLFTSDPDGDAFIFCFWWPWSNGKNISIRIAPYYRKLLNSDKAEKIQQFKSWFGI